jgi:benzodiazapine receptor
MVLFLIFPLACAAAGATGVLFPPGDWYAGLRKPDWTPPDRVFPLVWPILYVLMAIAGARLAGLPGSGAALALWAAQIALNTLWTPVFFGAHRLGAGLVVLGLLWLVVAALVIAAFGADWIAGLLLLPYFAWLCVALALNHAIWRLNG